MKKTTGWLLCGLVLATAPLEAGVTVGFDAAALNELLPAMTLQEVAVPIAGGTSLQVRFEELEVIGFAPSAGQGGANQILTSVRLRVPALGLSLALEPRMSLSVVEEAGRSVLELRFVEVSIPLPLAGSIDAAPYLKPLRFPADDVFFVAGTERDVEVHSRLAKIEMGVKIVRFEFDLDVVEPSPSGRPR